MNGPRESTSLIFVYGTLKRGFCRAAALADQQFVGEACTLARYRMVNCGSYPGLVDAVEGRSIVGEVWRVTADCLSRLDEIEDAASGRAGGGQYERRRIQLAPPHDRLEAEAYFYAWPSDDLPDCGDRW